MKDLIRTKQIGGGGGGGGGGVKSTLKGTHNPFNIYNMREQDIQWEEIYNAGHWLWKVDSPHENGLNVREKARFLINIFCINNCTIYQQRLYSWQTKEI